MKAIRAARRPRGSAGIGETPGRRGNRPPDPGTNVAPLRDGGGRRRRRGGRVRGRRDHRTRGAAGGRRRTTELRRSRQRSNRTEEEGTTGRGKGDQTARRGPEHRADHQRAAGGRFARGHLRPGGGAEHCGRHPPLGWQDLHRQELTARGSLPAPGGFGGGGRAPARAQRAGLRRHRLRRDDAAECAGVASAAGGRDISIKDTRELRQPRASCLPLEALGLDPRRDDGRRASLDGGPPRGGGWHRGCRSPVHRPDGGIRDHGARENRWWVEPVWPSPALGTKQQAERSPREHSRRQWR